VTGPAAKLRRAIPGTLSGLDWVAVALLVLGLACVVSGLLPWRDARGAVGRTLPLLAFLGSVIVLAELLAAAHVFDVVAARLAITARGSYPWLFGLCVLFASTTTIFLNLDTTAVLLTPVMLAVAGRAGMTPLPLAMTTVWFANIASLLLPVSNLTNLLAADRVDLPPRAFAGRMLVPQLAAIAVGAGFLWACYWRRRHRDNDRYQPPQRHVAPDRPLFFVASVDAAAFVVMVLAGLPLAWASAVCTVVIVAAFALRRRAALSLRLVPWRLLVMVVGLFLVVGAIDRLGLGDLLLHVVGTTDSAAGVWRSAGAGALLSNVVNNLPAYVAVEAAIPAGNASQLLGLLVGTNVGPLVTPWASLATLIWFERVRAAGLRISWLRFALTGAATCVGTLVAAVGGILLTR
jgi:arsenical pump membrane protein